MNRSGFFRQIAVAAIGTTVLQKQAWAALHNDMVDSDYLYIGSYTLNSAEGITTGWFDSQTGSIELVKVCKGVDNPSFLIFDNHRKFIYAVNETGDFGGKNSGSVSAFARDEKSGILTLLNMQPSLGAHPCHLAIDRTGKFILVANYTGGNVSVLPVLEDGSLGEPVEMVQHTGSGFNKQRQEAPHAHSVHLSPDNRFAFVCDLGLDRIMVYRFDPETGKLTEADRPWFQCLPGSGPRHFTFSRDGSRAFVVNELDSTITYLSYNLNDGVLEELQTLSTLPEGFTGENFPADVHLHPDGKFVYASNRGLDSIAVFAIDRESNQLNLIQNQSTLGKTPRNFVIHSSGKYLIAANQNSDSVAVFSLDPETGMLTETGKPIAISKPVCLLL